MPKSLRPVLCCLAALALLHGHAPLAAAAGTHAPEVIAEATAGPPITSGFVFVDGRYVPPPYTLSRQGLAVFVNGTKLETEATRCGDSPAELIAMRLDSVRQAYGKRLRADCCYFFFSGGGEIWLDTYIAAYTLPQIVGVLRSDLPDDTKLDELRGRGWQHSVGEAALRRLASGFVAPPEFDRRLEALGQALLRVEEFGRSAGAPVDAGFLFLGGRYVEAPYTVSREGLGVFVNGEMVQAPLRWPLPPLPSGETDPELPAGITRETSLYDDLLKDYLFEKLAYAEAHMSPEGERDFLEQAIRQLPCVKEADLDAERPSSLHVTTFRGESSTLLLRPVRRMPAGRSREDVLQRAESGRQRLETGLAGGRCLFVFRSGTRASIAAGPSRLRAMLAILRSADAAEVKTRKLREGPLSSLSRGTVARIVEDFSASQQLEARIEGLAAPTPHAP